MPFTFRRSFRVFPGVRINLNKNSTSLTFGFRHTPHYTVSSDGRRTASMNLLGGFGWRRTRRARRGR